MRVSVLLLDLLAVRFFFLSIGGKTLALSASKYLGTFWLVYTPNFDRRVLSIMQSNSFFVWQNLSLLLLLLLLTTTTTTNNSAQTRMVATAPPHATTPNLTNLTILTNVNLCMR